MKTKFYSTVLFFSLVFGGAAFSQTKTADIVHDFTRPGVSNVQPNNVIRFVKGFADKVIVAGQDSSVVGENQVFIAAFDYSGDLLWQQFVAIPTGNNWMDLSINQGLIQLADGNMAIAGIYGSTASNLEEGIPFVQIFNPSDGNVIQFKNYPTEAIWRLGSFIQDGQNGFLLAGIVQRDTAQTGLPNTYPSGNNIRLLKLNPNLDQEWAKTLITAGTVPMGAGPSDITEINNIFTDGSDIRVLVTGLANVSAYWQFKTSNDTAGLYTTHSIAVNLPWGNLISGGYVIKPRYSITTQKNNAGYLFLGAAINLDGTAGWYYGGVDNLLVNQWFKTYSFDYPSPFHTYSSGSGNFITTNFLNQEPPILNRADNKDLVMLQNSTIFEQSGNSSSYPFSYKNLLPFVMRTDELGDIKWQDTIRHTPLGLQNVNQSLTAMDLTNSGFIMMGGSIQTDSIFSDYQLDQPGRISWLTLMDDSNHNTPTGISQLPNDLANKITLYPNPATTEVWLSTDNDLHIKALTLFDVTGKRVKVFNPNERHLDISSLSKGIFYLKVITKKGFTVKSIVVE